MTTPILTLASIQKNYPAPGGAKIQVLKGIDLRVEPGESIAIVGPSGSGKSTLLNIIGLLDEPSSGLVSLDGQDTRALNDNEKARVRNRKIGFVFQQHHLLPQCSVLENVLVPGLVGAPDPGASARAEKLLGQVGLSERLDYRPGQLSGGEQLRVAVVRALINRPRLLLADEPTGSLDRAGAEKLGNLLVNMNEAQGLSLIVVTHSMALAARMKRAFTLMDGQLVPGSG